MSINPQPGSENATPRLSGWQQSSLKTKTVVVAIALSVLPVMVAEIAEFFYNNNLLRDKVTQDQEAKAILLGEGLNRFMGERYSDIQMLANSTILNDSRIAAETSLQAKQKILNQFIQSHAVYDSVALIDLDGKPTLSVGIPAAENYKESDFFKEALTTKRAVVGSPKKSEVNGVYSIFVAAPVIDTVTEKVIGVVRTRMPAAKVEEVFQDNPYFKQREHLFMDREGLVFSGTRKDEVGQPISRVFSAFSAFNLRQGVGTIATKNPQGASLLASYVPLKQLPTGPDLKWSIILAQDVGGLQSEQQRLVLIYFGIVIVSALGIGAIAALLSNRMTRPILEACSALQKLKQGDLDTRLSVQGEDELAVLGRNINGMAAQMQAFVRQKETEAERAQLVQRITLHISKSLKQEDILKAATQNTRQALKLDRVLVYQFGEDWSGTIVQEAVDPARSSAIAHSIRGSWFVEGYLENYRQGETVATPNVSEAGLTSRQLEQLESLNVKANLTAPIFVDRQLIALFIGHQCSEPRIWQPEDIDLFAKVAIQIGFAWEQANRLKQVETAWQDQRDETKSLRSQLMHPLADVETALIKDEKTVRDLAAALHSQLESSTLTFRSVEQMSHAIQTISDQVQSMSVFSKTVAATAEAGEASADRSAQQVETVQAETYKAIDKIKHLEKSSQRMAIVISQMKEFATQTAAQLSVFAVNTSLEASRAKEGGQLAHLASEMRELAHRSVTTTQAIEQTINEIQQEIAGAVALLNSGTTQATAGAQSIQEARQKLRQILDTSEQLDQIVFAITKAVRLQNQTAQTARESVNTIVDNAKQATCTTDQVSTALQKMIESVQQIQRI